MGYRKARSKKTKNTISQKILSFYTNLTFTVNVYIIYKNFIGNNILPVYFRI